MLDYFPSKLGTTGISQRVKDPLIRVIQRFLAGKEERIHLI